MFDAASNSYGHPTPPLLQEENIATTATSANTLDRFFTNLEFILFVFKISIIDNKSTNNDISLLFVM